MKIDVQPGRYVVAVSGGVDSVALLRMLLQLPHVQLVVAHYDHGIRDDSVEDRKLVQNLASIYDLPFVYDEGHLGAGASEANAREARYRFLHTVKHNSGAEAIITAHHQDDVIETALLNMLRGTGRKGLTSLQTTSDIIRPLLDMSKDEIIAYAKENKLVWREDSTNTDESLRRNYVRRKLVTKLTSQQKNELLTYITKLRDLNHQIDRALEEQLHIQPGAKLLDRQYFIRLPHGVAKELLAAWLRQYEVRDFDAKGLERMVVAAKTYQAGQFIDVNKKYYIYVTREDLALKMRDR